MARTRIGFGKKKRKVSYGESRPWGDMDSNILFKIFSSLPTIDLFFTISAVCRSWKSASWEVFFWRDEHTLDLTRLKSLVRRVFSGTNPWLEKRAYREALLKTMEYLLMNPHALGNGDRCVTSIIIPRNLYITGHEDITLVAKRTHNLKRLELKDAFGLEDGCFSEALKNWKSLKEISIGPAYNRHVVHIIQELGIHCKNLHTLRLDIIKLSFGESHFVLDLSSAKLIASYLPKLKEFSIKRGELHKDGVSAILNECKQLSALYIKSCYILPEEIYKLSLKFEKKTRGINLMSKWFVIGRKAHLRTIVDHGLPLFRRLDKQETLQIIQEISEGS